METIKKTINLKDFDLSLYNYEEGLSVNITDYHGKDDHVTIPGYVQGIKIKEIDINAFKGKDKIKKITIEKGVAYIYISAFEDCTELTEVELPEGFLGIDMDAFKGCKKLEKINFPESVLYIRGGSFEDCEKLTRVFIPKNVSELNFFEGCHRLKEIIVDDENLKYSSMEGILYNEAKTRLIRYPDGKKGASCTIPDTVFVIARHAFGSNNNLVTINLPPGLSYFFPYTFSFCVKLKQVIIKDDNPRFKTVDGVLFDKELKTIIFYPFARKGTKYAIPDGIEVIKEGAFFCRDLKEIIFPESLKLIEKSAFEKCKFLASITLPAQLMGICKDAFKGCEKLEKVTLSRKTKIGQGAFEGISPEFVYID